MHRQSRRPKEPPSEDDLEIISEDDCEDEGSSTHGDSSSKTVVKARTTEDDKLVMCSRVVVLTVLMLTAFIIARMAFYIVSRNERDNFESEFKTNAQQVAHMADKNVKNIFTSIQTLSNVFPSASHQAHHVLPYVTVEDYEPFGDGTRKVSKASLIAYSPILRTQTDLNVWNTYVMNHTSWVSEAREYQASIKASTPPSDAAHVHNDDHHHETRELAHSEYDDVVPMDVYKIDKDGSKVPEFGDGIFAPLWQTTPAPDDSQILNFNLASNPAFEDVLSYVLRSKRVVLSKLLDPRSLFGMEATVVSGKVDASPSSLLVHPVFDQEFKRAETQKKVLGVVSAVIPWKDFFDDVLPDGHSGVYLVADICGQNVTYIIKGLEVAYQGPGDLHDRRYSDSEWFSEFDIGSNDGYCHQHIHIFPTDELWRSYETNTPIIYASTILLLFVFSAIVFVAYDWFVTKRQNKTELKASKTNAIVQELFPDHVAAQMFQSSKEASVEANESDGLLAGLGSIAQLYPAATVLFADIAGFTAWSSMRDPRQVFLLLETIFQAFDLLAKKRGIYKVETIGDCYVAVCGVPKPNVDHAVQMARFAKAAVVTFYEILLRLELTLGPDTVELGMRFGMHSGPVTAGVLRGDRARFQLFGDTVNTAARIESSGRRGRIHLSEQTAVELIANGKEDWVTRREDVVEAKGKGKLVTYWLNHPLEVKPSGGKSAGTISTSWHGSEESETALGETELSLFDQSRDPDKRPEGLASTSGDRNQRLVDWNCELLLELLNEVVSRREALGVEKTSIVKEDLDIVARSIGVGFTVADEVAEVIEMPEYVHVAVLAQAQLSHEVKSQLRAYVLSIASMYNDNPFHNFDHASHVTMSVHKLLTRIVAPNGKRETQRDEILHDHTYGITSDPMTQFAVVLSGLIHDLDHPGVPNSQLAKENPSLAKRYKERSVAEQNSIDLAWQALLLPEYNQLRSAIFGTEKELRRFRQLLVNSIIATDIFDKDLGALRKNRWNKAFQLLTSEEKQANITNPRECINRKATIIIEHLIQASDVAHTMQHWHVYQKWNHRLFDEMMMAYRDGRSDKDPSICWYDGELGFFDHYIIPLAKKLKNCGVFGVCGDEYLNYALQNRSEWAGKGQCIVQQYKEEFEKKSM